MTATFDSAVPVETTVEVTKGTTVIDGKHAIDGSTIVFDATGNLTAGTYTFTATLGETKVSKEVEVKDSYVAEIKITSAEALTGKKDKNPETKDSTAAYIYYDVLNQYGESVRTSENIEWTTSPDNKTVDKALGRITITKDEPFTYGSLIYVTGVHVKSGTSISTSIPVGMTQAVDTIEFAGFLSKNDKTKILDSLPADFARKTYVLLYKTFDQNGNALDVTDSEFAGDNLTFICDSPLLIDSSLKKEEDVYTVNGEEYAAVAIEPGDYVDKGGEFNITAISNKTGKKTIKNFVVGNAGLLQSLVLSSPAKTVADGDQDVEIPYVAKDTDGNTITNYETIVRSTNSLSLSSSEDTTLCVKEKNDGTAGIYWSDDKAKHDPKSVNNYSDSSAYNGIDRNISLTTVVVGGGESNNMMLAVSDARRPVAIKSINLNDDYNDAIIDGNKATISMQDGDDNCFTFIDQYGADLDKEVASTFFKYTGTNKFDKDYYYGIKVDVTGTVANQLGLTDAVYYDDDADGKINIPVTATSPVVNSKKEVKNETVKYTIARTKVTPTSATTNWDDTSKVKSVAYTIVPMSEISDFMISDMSKVWFPTTKSKEDNGSTIEVANYSKPATSDNGNWFDENYRAEYRVYASYKGLKLSVPHAYYNDNADSPVKSNSYYTHIWMNGADQGDNPAAVKSQVGSVSGGALSWSDLYDVNSAKNVRKDATLDLIVDVFTTTGQAIKISTVKKKVTISDAKPVATSIKFVMNTNDGFNTVSATTGILYPVMTNLTQPEVFKYSWRSWNDNIGVMVFDQYGKEMTGNNLYNGISDGYKDNDYNEALGYATMIANSNSYVEFTVSNIKENLGAFAHKPDNFVVKQNGSANMSIEGAEIGDTFDLTASVNGLSVTATITVGADKAAYIQQGDNGKKETVDNLGNLVPGTKDTGLREILGYDR